MVNINIQKKDLWLLSAIIVFLVGVVFVIAIDSNDYTIHGHDAGEIEELCGWKAMTTTTTKPSGGSCNLGNIIAYITPNMAAEKGVTGFCRFNRGDNNQELVYGYLETIYKSYEGFDYIMRCIAKDGVPTISTDSGCGVDATGIAEYMVC